MTWGKQNVVHDLLGPHAHFTRNNQSIPHQMCQTATVHPIQTDGKDIALDLIFAVKEWHWKTTWDPLLWENYGRTATVQQRAEREMNSSPCTRERAVTTQQVPQIVWSNTQYRVSEWVSHRRSRDFPQIGTKEEAAGVTNLNTYES